MLSDQIADILD